jgi:hypothetical protein
MAVTYATHLYNHLPNAQGLCPSDLFTGSTVPRHRLKDIHVWGCPVYILDPHLQAGQKLPRWQPRSRRGIFMGFSTLHSSEVPLVLNLDTGSITPQYHVVFDDQFSTVTSVEREIDPPDNWAELCMENTTFVPTDTDTDDIGAETTTKASLGFEWMTPDERDWAARAMIRQDAVRNTLTGVSTVPTHTPTSIPPVAKIKDTSSTMKSVSSLVPSSLDTVLEPSEPPLSRLPSGIPFVWRLNISSQYLIEYSLYPFSIYIVVGSLNRLNDLNASSSEGAYRYHFAFMTCSPFVVLQMPRLVRPLSTLRDLTPWKLLPQ